MTFVYKPSVSTSSNHSLQDSISSASDCFGDKVKMVCVLLSF